MPDALLELVIDEAFAHSKRLRKVTRRILRAQKRLRRVASVDAWAAYLALEEAVNARTDEQMQILCKRIVSLLADRPF